MKSTAGEILAAANGRHIMHIMLVNMLKAGLAAGVSAEEILAEMQSHEATIKDAVELAEKEYRETL